MSGAGLPFYRGDIGSQRRAGYYIPVAGTFGHAAWQAARNMARNYGQWAAPAVSAAGPAMYSAARKYLSAAPRRASKARLRKTRVRSYTTKIGDGLRQRRKVLTTRSKKKRSAKVSKTFKNKVQKVINLDKESQVKMYLLKNDGVSQDGAATLVPYTHGMLHGRIVEDDMFVPPGLEDNDLDGTSVEASIYKGGRTILPFNVVEKATTHMALAAEGNDNPRHQGQTFNPMSCVVDYGWTEGGTFAGNHNYGRTEVVFGIIKNQQKLQNIMDKHSWTLEKCINLVLGPPGKVDNSVLGCNWKFRDLGDVTAANQEDEQYRKDRRLLTGLFKILKRDTNFHRQVVSIDADGGEGVTAETTTTLGKLFGSGSFAFPHSELKKLERTEAEVGSTGNFAISYLGHKRNIPFIHLRGCATPNATGTQALTAAVANDGLAIALRYKIRVADDN